MRASELENLVDSAVELVVAYNPVFALLVIQIELFELLLVPP